VAKKGWTGESHASNRTFFCGQKVTLRNRVTHVGPVSPAESHKNNMAEKEGRRGTDRKLVELLPSGEPAPTRSQRLKNHAKRKDLTGVPAQEKLQFSAAKTADMTSEIGGGGAW